MNSGIMQKKASVKLYFAQQKRIVKHRIVNPVRYCLDLIRVHKERMYRFRKIDRVIRVALVSDLDSGSSEAQFHPFSTYRRELRQELGLVSAHLMLKDVLLGPRIVLSPFDLLILKLSYRTDASEALEVVRTLRRAIGTRYFIYYDGDDDLCVQWSDILYYLDLYVKKHAFLDRGQYCHTFVGKSNLHDYVCHRYNHLLSPRDYGNSWDKQIMISKSGPVPATQLDKIFLGVDMACDNRIIELYVSMKDQMPARRLRELDVTFRGSVTKETMTHYLRRDIEPALMTMMNTYNILLSAKKIPQDEYYLEMFRSKICVSPFGYGEVCYRDYEAILCGCLLVKPDMGHVESNPNIFQPFATYVPVKWDFTDLQEKCEYYLRNEVERKRIVTTAYGVLEEFYKSGGFVRSLGLMTSHLYSLATLSDRSI